MNVLTQHNDNRRTGANLAETRLTTLNVNPQRFGKLFERTVDGYVYAQPLYLSNVAVQGQGTRNVVYVATMHNTVFAFDADDPAASAALWSRSLGPPVPLPDNKVGGQGYRDIAVEVGIVSTPVISAQRNALYVVALTKENNVYRHRLHALDVRSGAELFGGPRMISAGVPGAGSGSANGNVQFTSYLQNQRPALLLAGGVVYAAFASYGDNGPYHGWVLGFNADTLQPLANVFNTTADGEQGGIWQAGQGPAADEANNLYFMTGNGTFAETHIGGKVTLPETAVGAPAVINVNDQTLALAWTGTDPQHRLNVQSSADGRSFTGKVTLNEASVDGPGFAFGSGRAFIAWAGTDSDHKLNVMSSPDCRNFSNKVTLGEASNFGPALAFGNGQLFIAWTGKDANSSLNVMSSADGVHFGNKVTLSESSATSPGLAFAGGQLYLLWRGTDPARSLNVMEFNSRSKVTLGDASDFHPALAGLGGFKLVWTGRDQSQSLNLLTGPGTHNLGDKQTYGDAASASPSLVAYQGQLVICWTGTDGEHHLNVARVVASPLLGDSFVKLAPDLTLADWFSPFNTQELNAHDTDLGSGGPLLIPNTQLLVGGGKEGKLYLLDRNKLGHFCSTCTAPAGDTQIVQWFQATGLPNQGTPPPPPAPFSGGFHHIHGSPVYWDSPNRGPIIYVWGEADWLRAFTFDGARFNPFPADISSVTTPGGSMPGAMLSLSANGNNPGTGIIWASHPTSQNANQQVVDGTIRAIDAMNLGSELWNSDMNHARDGLGKISKFSPPTVADGKVYVATFSNKLVVYGPLP